MRAKFKHWCNDHPILTGITVSCGVMLVVAIEILFPPFVLILFSAALLALVAFGLGLIIHDDIGVSRTVFHTVVLMLSAGGSIYTILMASADSIFPILVLTFWMTCWLMISALYIDHQERKAQQASLTSNEPMQLALIKGELAE